MQIIRFLVIKMWNNKWLTLSSLLGLVIAVALSTSIPMYTNGSLKNLIYKELDEYESGLPPGALTIRYQTVASNFPEFEKVAEIQEFIESEVPKIADFPTEHFVSIYGIRAQSVRPEDTEKTDGSKRRQFGLISMTGIKDQVDLSDGEFFSDEIKNGVIEAIVPEDAPFIHDYRLGTIFTYPVAGVKGMGHLRIKVVGTFSPKDVASDYWFQGQDTLTNSLIISEKVMVDDLLAKGLPLNTGNWYYAFDLKEIKTTEMRSARKWLETLDVKLNKILPNTRTEISFHDLLVKFNTQDIQLRTLLFTLAAPILVLVFYFISMNSRQSLERQRGDIAVLKSRGGSTRQIFWLFLIEGLLLGGVALIIGPVMGYLMAKSLGSSSGFLYFVNRQAIAIQVSWDVWVYGILSVLLALAASVIPALRYARTSIVDHQRTVARAEKSPLWQKLFLDVLLFGVAAYGWYLFAQRQVTLVTTGLTSDQLQVHPLLFFVPAIFLFACGLLYLRVLPWLLKLFFLLMKRFTTVPIYLTMTQLTRSTRQYHAVMLLLTLTLGLGVYNASAARTIDLNSTDRALYQYGTDVIIQTQWETRVDPEDLKNQNPGGGPGGGNPGGQPGGGSGGGGPGGGPGGGGGQGPDYSNIPLHYVEPPFEVFRSLEGVEGVARVLNGKAVAAIGNKSLGDGNFMAIDNADFYTVAHDNFKDSLLKPYSFDQYLNVLGNNEAALITSTKFIEKYDLELGSTITLVIKQRPVEFILYAAAPYWPTLYPDEAPFFIVNLDYLQDHIPLEPYNVWMKVAEGGKVAEMVEALAEKDIYLVSIDDYRAELIREKRHPSRGGVFGVLSLGFLVSITISLIGYILYWFFSLSARTVQFGILRATGLTKRELATMLILEQILTAGTAIVIGLLSGRLASKIFIPFMQTSGSAQTQVPPFQVIFEQSDLKNLLIVVTVMMSIGIGLLLIRIRSLRIHQAVKLGEER